MKTSLDCIPCLLRQTLDAARLVSKDPAIHENIMRDVLGWAGEMDLTQSPPALAQRFHRRVREISRVDDPYRETKDRQNMIALKMISSLRLKIESASDPLLVAVRLAIAGNVIDMGVNAKLTEAGVLQEMKRALTEPLVGDYDGFRKDLAKAESILYLTDNAGEIAFDQLLIKSILPKRVTLVVRGGPVINDATVDDAKAVGLDKIVEIINNGSDAPGTILRDCSPEFRRRFSNTDMIIAKGQGNFETLSDEPGNIYFLFKVKCPLVADLVNQPIGIQMLSKTKSGEK